MGKFANRRELLWVAAFALVAIVAVFAYMQGSDGRNLKKTVGTRISLLDLANLDDATLKRLTLADLNQEGLKALGIRDLKDARLSKIHLYDLREKYLAKVELEELKAPVLASLKVGDLADSSWLNQPAPPPRVVNTVATANQSEATTPVAKPNDEAKKSTVAHSPSMTIVPLPLAKPATKQQQQHAPRATAPKVAYKPAPAPKRQSTQHYIAARPLPTRRYLQYRTYSAPKRPVAVERRQVAYRPSPAPRRYNVPRVAPDYGRYTAYVPQVAPEFERRRVRQFARIIGRAPSRLKRLPSVIFRILD